MFINPTVAIERGWVTGIKNPDVQVQPNAIDFTLDHLYEIKHNDFIICNDTVNPGKEIKQMRGTTEISPYPDRRSGVQFYGIGNSSYDGLSDVYVNLPEDVAAMTIIRSTFNRNGIFLTSGLYDTGYKGHIGFVLHSRIGTAKIEQGIRIGQIMFVEASSAGVYAGGYNHDVGTTAKQHGG
jgi:deoxycytidine triphosphate deaminase